jgi:hypothetical protein
MIYGGTLYGVSRFHPGQFERKIRVVPGFNRS